MPLSDFPAADKSLEGVLRDLYQRSDEQARRVGPERLSAAGRQVGDWNDALDDGFYWSLGTALNGPSSINNSNSIMGWVVNTFTDTGLMGTRQYAARSTLNVLETRYRSTVGTWTDWQMIGTYNAGTIPESKAPDTFPVGVTHGFSDASYPGGVGSVVEVVHSQAARTVMRATRKGDVPLASATYERSASGAGSTWGPWILIAGDTGWVDLSAHFAAGSSVYARQSGATAMMRGLCPTDIAIGTGITDITTSAIPTEWRPSGVLPNSWGSLYSGGYSATVLLRPVGTVAVSNRNPGTLVSDLLWSITYFIG